MNFGASFPRFRRSSASPERQRGWALVTVLWAVAILSMLAAASETLTITSARIEHRAQDEARAGSDLDAAIARAVSGIEDGDPAQRWRVDGIARDFAFDGLQIRVAVQDQLGCIDLNTADVTSLRQLLQGAGLAPDAAGSVAEKILDWRSSADLRSLHGATDADYAAAGYSYRQRHGPFQTVDEVKLVMGMTPALFARIAPALTVYSHRPSFDSAVAPRAALLALYPDDPGQADKILAQREAGSGLASTNPNSVPPGTVSPSASFADRAFAIDAGLVLHGKLFLRHAVVETTGDGKVPYLVLAWR
jgi:general secretion pathway protein K